MKLRRGQEQAAPNGSHPTIDVDPFIGDDEMRGAVDALAAGSWREAEKLIEDRPHPMEWSLLRDSVPTAVIEAWARTEPSARSLSLLGATYVRDAWEIRTASRAEDVDPSRWRGFLSKLEQAETILRWVAATWRDAPEPWAPLLDTCRGLEMGQNEARARFANLQRRSPFHPSGCASMLQSLCHKWGGSHEAMFEFARWVDQNAPADSPAREVLPVAHIEYLLSEDLSTREYFAQPHVVQELAGSAERFLTAIPDHPPPAHVPALNAYTICAFPVDARTARLAGELFRRIGDRATPFPWNRFDSDLGIVFASTRVQRLEAAQRFL